MAKPRVYNTLADAMVYIMDRSRLMTNDCIIFTDMILKNRHPFMGKEV